MEGPEADALAPHCQLAVLNWGREVLSSRTIALGWWSGIEASCPEGLPILEGCSVGPQWSRIGCNFKTLGGWQRSAYRH